MSSSAVFCSDVMDFPDEFAGTKGIIHPDDLSRLIGALSLMQEKELPRLDFRLITTYGEVKTISGQRVSVDMEPAQRLEPVPGKEPWEEALQVLAAKKENDFLQLRKELADYTERLHGVGSWLVNKKTGEAWYSDNVYRIYGMAAQSLNAHANTFNEFIHKDDHVAVLDAFEKAYAEEVPLHIEYRIVSADGEVRYIQQVTRWIFSNAGQLMFSGVVRDVTPERAIADELLAAQSLSLVHQQVLKMSEEHSATGFWMIDLATRKTSYSDNYYRIYGFKRPYLPAYNSFLNLVDSEDRAHMREAVERMYTEHILPETEFRIIRPDGKKRHLRQSGKLFVSPNQELVMIGIVQDVSVQKGLEKKILELGETISLNRAVMEMTEAAAETCYFTWLPDGLMQWSDGFYRMLGYKPGGVEPLPRFLYKNIHPADLKTFRDAEALLLNQQSHDDIEIRLVSRGGLRRVRFSFRQVNYGRDATIALVHDVSRQSELSEKFSHNQLYTQLVEASVDNLIIFTNSDNTITHWNKAAAEKTGIATADALQDNLFDVLPALKEMGFMGQLHLALKGTEAHSSRVINAYIKKPHDYWLWPLKSESGEVSGVLHVVRDISRQLELQHQLSERLNFIESLVESSVDRIVVLDRFMNYLYWNRRAEEYNAISKEKVLGKNILEVFPSFRNHPGYQQFRTVLKGETVYLPPKPSEDSDEYFETYLIPVKDDSGEVTAVLWIVHDLRKELQLQREQWKAQQLLYEEHQRLLKAQQEIQVREQLLQATTDSSVDMIQVFEAVRNAEGEIVDFKWILNNHAAEEKYGNVIGKSLLHLNPGVLDEGIFETFKKVVETGIPDQSERHYAHEQFDGWFHQSTVKLNDGVATTTRDISEPKRAQQEILRLKDEAAQKATDRYYSIFNSIDEGFCIIERVRDGEGKGTDLVFSEANAAFLAGTGVPDVVGKTVRELLPAFQSHWTEMYSHVSGTGESIRSEIHLQEADRWYSIFFSPIGDKESPFVAVVFTDITERKKVEEKLKNFNTQLEQQIDERTRELQKQLTLLRYTEYLAQSGSWEYEVRSGDFSWSEGMYRIFGLPMEMKVRPETYLDCVIDEDRSIAKKIVAALKKKHHPFEEVIRIRKGKDTRTIKIKSSVIADEKGVARKIVGVDIDVTNIQKTEEQLRESRHWLEQTAIASPDSISVYDTQGKQPTYLNNCLADWLGLTSHDLVLMGLEGRLQLIHPDDRLNLLHHNEKAAAAKDGEITTLEYRMRTDDDRIIWVRNRSKPFQRDAKGKVTHILSILQNVTEEVALREELKLRSQYAESIIDASIDRIAVYDKDLRIIAWNRRSEEVTGRKKQIVLGQKLLDLFPRIEQDEELFRAHLDALAGSYVSLPAKKGVYTNSYYERFYIPLKNERKETYAIVAIMHDVSRLVHQNQELTELNRALESKNRELEQKNEEITSFAFVASHDMKEPLRKIHTFSDWLVEQETGQLSQRGKELLEKINASVHRMEVLIEDILVLTRIHTDVHKDEKVNLDEIVMQVMDDMSETIRITQTIVKADTLPVITANANQLFYLFKNLVSNAIKFQKPGNVPQITIRSEVVSGEETDLPNAHEQYARISFTDNGFGFDQRYAKKIFQVFQRLHGRNEFEGTGIGLAICRKIMENHGGFITVESEQGRGSIFRCYFPL